jgi:hypothetical protein
MFKLLIVVTTLAGQPLFLGQHKETFKDEAACNAQIAADAPKFAQAFAEDKSLPPVKVIMKCKLDADDSI